ncbi:hypothetical protein RB595_002568 [Gaeumannomyces hyphopodioides]
MATLSGFVPGAELDTSVAELSQAIRDLRSSVERGAVDPKQRGKAIELAQAVLGSLKHPIEAMMDDYFGVSFLMATRLFADLGGFEHIPSEGPISYNDLAKKLDSDSALIRRVAWVLVANGLLKQVDGDKVTHTPRSKVFTGPHSLHPAFQYMTSMNIPALFALPDYFKKYGRKEPATRTHTPYSFAKGKPELTVWEVMRQDPDRNGVAEGMRAFGAFEKMMPMTGVYDFSWVAREAAADSTGTRTLLVDVGASKGHVTKAICESTPGLPMSRCVLQDLPEVVKELEKADDPALRDAQKIAMDFHQEQPVKGALVYFIRRCLHDYGDEECVKILRVIADAMAPDSRLVIIEQIISNPPIAMAAAIDLVMMNLGGKERTVEGFGELASKAGLKISNVDLTEGFGLSAVECVKA